MAIDRRSFVATAALSMGVVAFGQGAGAPRPERRKGQPVWLDLDQRELDDAYDRNVYAANREQILGRVAVNSEAVRQRIGAPRYGLLGRFVLAQMGLG